MIEKLILIFGFVLILSIVQAEAKNYGGEVNQSSQNIIIFLHASNCTLIPRNESEYSQFLNAQCANLHLNESLTISEENISKVFIPSPGNSMVGFKIEKNSTNVCTVDFSCSYTRWVVETIRVSDALSVAYVPYTVQIELSDINVLDLSEYRPSIELKNIKIECNQVEQKTEILKVNNVSYNITCKEKDILINLSGNPIYYPFDIYSAKIEADHLDLSLIKEKLEYISKKHNFLELTLSKENNRFVLKLQRRIDEKQRVFVGLITSSFIFIFLIVFFEKENALKFVLELLFGVIFIGSFLNSFAYFKITTILSLFFLSLFTIFYVIVREMRKKLKLQSKTEDFISTNTDK